MHTIFLSTKGPNLSTCTGVNARVSTHGPINLSQQLGFQSLGPRFKPAALSLSLTKNVGDESIVDFDFFIILGLIWSRSPLGYKVSLSIVCVNLCVCVYIFCFSSINLVFYSVFHPSIVVIVWNNWLIFIHISLIIISTADQRMSCFQQQKVGFVNALRSLLLRKLVEAPFCQ